MAKDDETKASEIETVEGIEQLKILFTDAERAEHAQSLARIFPELARIEDEKKAVVSQFKSNIESLQAQANQLSSYVRDGWHYGPVAVKVERDYRNNTFTKTRTDTGEVIQERALTDAERQRSLGV